MDSRRSRFGWSSGGWARGPISPISSGLGHDGQPPDVQDDDFSYITSEDLENHQAEQSRYYSPRSSNPHVARSDSALEIPADDIILIKYKGVTYPEHFPAYSIADGKVLAVDIRERLQLIKQLSDEQTDRLKLYYKGRELKDDNEPAARYGIKNKSEVLVVLPDEVTEGSSESSEEIVVVQGGDREGTKKNPKGKGDRKSKKKQSSPRDSNSGVNLSVPQAGEERKGSTDGRNPSPAASAGSVASYAYPPAAPGSAMDKLNKILMNFNDNLRPLCDEFASNPPSDPKKREDEHRKISETVLQQVLLKLDEVDTGGDEAVRSRRRELVREVQSVLSRVDKWVPEGKKSGI